MRFKKYYFFNVWVLTVIVGSICFAFSLLMANVILGPDELFRVIVIAIFFSAVFSWPVYFLSHFLIRYLIRKNKSLPRIRVYLAIIGIVTIILSGLFFFGDFTEDSTSIIGLMCYVVTFVFSLFAIPIGVKDH